MKGIIKILRTTCSHLLMVSLILFGTSYGGVAYAADTGGYPWADATLIRASTYDWGYRNCQPAMVQAKTCSAHYGYKDGVTYHESDPWKYDVRNCTSYVAWRVNDMYQINLRGWGDAKNWSAMAQKQGFVVNNSPKTGDIAVWNSGRYGHVAFVTSVNLDGSVNVEQYNKGGNGEFSRQSRVRANSYIHVAPIVTSRPPIEIPVLSQTVVQAVTESLPVNPLPEDKPIVPVQPASQISAPSVIAPKVSEPTPEVVNQDVSYFVESQAGKNIKAYAIKHRNTKSGKIEVHSTDVTSRDATWSAEKVTLQSIQTPRATAFAIADHNGDGVNDMYQIVYSNTDSKKVEISVLDGSKDYTTYIGSWVSAEEHHGLKDAWYSLADFNGDSILDLYQVWHNNTADNFIHVSVLDGKSEYKQYLTSYVLPESKHDSLDAYYMLGDHNNDGMNDVYQVLHNNTASGNTEIKVFDGLKSGVIMSRWNSDTHQYSGEGPNLQDVII